MSNALTDGNKKPRHARYAVFPRLGGNKALKEHLHQTEVVDKKNLIKLY